MKTRQISICLQSEEQALGLLRFFPAEYKAENSSYQRLDKEKLCKESKGKIKTYKLQPVCQKCDEMKTGIIRMV